MENQERLIVRARLLASGIIRYWQYDKSTEVRNWLAIMAEELAKIEEPGVVLNIQESLRRFGLHVPEWSAPPPLDGLAQGRAGAETQSNSSKDETEPEPGAFVYNRRANNQVSECLEGCIRDLLRRGLSKSAVARALRVNRRVVIRVATEAQSAQQNRKCRTNDLGT
jgi:hypothetical protein